VFHYKILKKIREKSAFFSVIRVPIYTSAFVQKNNKLLILNPKEIKKPAFEKTKAGKKYK